MLNEAAYRNVVEKSLFFPELHEATKLVDRRTSSFRFYFFGYINLFIYLFFFFLVVVCFSSVIRAHRRCTATTIVARSSKWIVRADREQETTQRERENTAERHGCCSFFFFATIFKNAYTCVKKGGNITRGMQTVRRGFWIRLSSVSNKLQGTLTER